MWRMRMTQRKKLYTKPRARRRRMCALERRSLQNTQKKTGTGRKRGAKKKKDAAAKAIADDTQLPDENFVTKLKCFLMYVSASARHSGRARKAAEPPPGFVYTLNLAREFTSDSDRE
jgi:hypothetical protein